MTDRTVVYRLQAETSQFKAQMAAAGASVKKSADDMTAATKEGDKFRKGLDSLGGTAGKVGLVAAAGLGAAIMKAANFDQAMSNVAAATHESTKNMDLLRKAALDAGASTVFSATEAATGIEELAKAGVATTDVLSGGLAGALDLAAAGSVSVAEAAETAASAMTQFKLQGSEVPHIADLLAAAAGKAQGSVHDMGMALSQSGLVASQVGLSIEEATGALGAFASAGLIGSDAGTSLKTMLLNLTPTSSKAQKMMDALGVSAYDTQGNFVGLAEYAGILRNAMSDMSAEQRTATMKTLFGNDAIRAANVLYEQGADGIQGWINKVDDSGYAAETAAIKLDNLKGDLEELGGALETALIGTGSGSQGPLRALTQSLTDAVNSYNALGEGAKSGVAVTLGATAALGGGLFVFSKMVQSIAATRVAMEALGLSAVKTQTLVATAAKGMGVALAAGLAHAAGDLFDVDYSLDSINRQLTLLATTGDAAGLFEDLSMSAEDLGEALRDAAYNDFNMFGMGSASEIKELDEALSSLDPETAALAFETITEAGKKAGVEVADLKALFPQYAASIELAAAEVEAGIAPTADFAEATDGLAEAASAAAAETKAFKDVIDGLNSVLDGRGNVRNYQAAIDDLADSLKENGHTFDVTTEKGRNNQAALDDIAASALSVAETLEGAARKKFLTNAIADLRTMGENMDLPKAQIEALIELLRTANKATVNPKINVDTDSAKDNIRDVFREIEALDGKTASVFIRTVRSESGKGPLLPGSANGSTVPKDGGSYSDRFPYLLAPGEEVISNRHGQADRHRPLLKAINAGRLADGGTAGKKKPKLSLQDASDSDFWQERLERAEERRENRETAREQREEEAADRAEESAAREEEARQDWLSGQKDANSEWISAADKQLQAWETIADGIEAQMDALAQSTTSGFRTGLFEKDDNAWGSNGGGWFANMTSDIAGLKERGILQTELAGLGLDGPALDAALSQGSNADLRALIDSGDVQTFEDMFNEREGLYASVGEQAGELAYGKEFAAANVEVAKFTGLLATLNARLDQIDAELNPRSAAYNNGFAEAVGQIPGAVRDGIVNGGGTVARRGTGSGY